MGGSVPAARCNIGNLASRKTLQKAGFVPCGNLVAGDLVKDALAYKDADFLFNGSMEGGLDRALPAFTDFVKAMSDAGGKMPFFGLTTLW